MLATRDICRLHVLAPQAHVTSLIEEGRGHLARQVKIIVRQGDPRRVPDLHRVCAADASKVILLTADSDRGKLTDGNAFSLVSPHAVQSCNTAADNASKRRGARLGIAEGDKIDYERIQKIC